MRRMIFRIVSSSVLLGVAYLLPVTGWLRLAAFALPYLIIGWDVLLKAIKRIARLELFDENFLMALATVGAFGIKEYPEAVFVMLFYQIGELFQDAAVDKSRDSIAKLMDIKPDYANLEVNGEIQKVSPEQVVIDDVIVVRPGERVPLDGYIVEGRTSLNMTSLTGESIPKDVSVGDSVISGSVNINGLIKLRVTKEFGDSTVSRILKLVEESSEHKAEAENFITKFAKWYTPLVVAAALAMALIVPIFAGEWSMWIHRTLVFLVVSCPCALVVSVPLSFFGGIGGASKCGILIKGANYLEALAKSETVIFDKTGTITKGRFAVTEIAPEGITKEELLELTALVEGYSDHPISLSIIEAYGKNPDMSAVNAVEEMAGYGVKAEVNGRVVYAGNGRLMKKIGIECEGENQGTVVHVAADNVYVGHIKIEDQIKPEAAQAIRNLKSAGIKNTVMLTGDKKEVAETVAEAVGIDRVYSELLPDEKVNITEEIIRNKTKGSNVVFVGDGINDAPSLACSDVGIAMGGIGSDAAIEAADVVLMDDNINKIPLAVRISRRTLRIVKQNIFIALAVKFVVLGLSTVGYANLWWAVFADVGVLILATINAMRCLTITEK